jgi:hypothetical protein
MNMKVYVKKAELFIGLCLIIALSTSSASAWGGGRHGGYGHGFYGYHGWGVYRPYYWGLDYTLVSPPIGAVVPYLPDGYTTYVIGGIPYYYFGGYYFQTCPSGYVVVPQPEAPSAGTTAPSQTVQSQTSATQTVQPGSAVAKSASAVSAPLAKAASDDGAITINIPNSTGGFTAVKLTRFKDGYKGPQGEFYPNHPTVDELKALYGGAQ